MYKRQGYESVFNCTTGSKAIPLADTLGEGVIISGYRLTDMPYTCLLYTSYPMNKNVQIRANDNGAKTHILSNPTKDTTGNTIWDCVYFGNYYQNDVEGKYKEPIKWRVLKVDGNDAFLLADKGLDVKPWHESGDGVCLLYTSNM